MCLLYFNLTTWHWDFLQASVVCGLFCWAGSCVDAWERHSIRLYSLAQLCWKIKSSKLREKLSLEHQCLSTASHSPEIRVCPLIKQSTERRRYWAQPGTDCSYDLSVPSSGDWTGLTLARLSLSPCFLTCQFGLLAIQSYNACFYL